MRKRLVYWLARTLSPREREKAALLAEKECEVQFFSDLPQLIQAFSVQRAGTVVLSDEGSQEDSRALMIRACATPELYGVRFILSLRDQRAETLRTAYGLGFRDIIPSDLEKRAWLRRFLFSTSVAPTSLPQPHPMMSLNAISAVHVPARVIWVSPSRMRIETRVSAGIGSKLHMSGPIADYLGLKTATLTVLEKPRLNLRYRFAEAFVCQWQAPDNTLRKKGLLLEHLRKVDVGAACRAFGVIQSPEIRSELLEILKAPRFEVAMALNRKGISEEPKYFHPHIVFIEDRMLTSDGWGQVEELLQSLESRVPIVVLGLNADFDRLRGIALGRKIIPLPRLKPTLPMMIFEKYLPHRWLSGLNEPEDAHLVHAGSEFSFSEIKLPARLRGVHPHAAELALPMQVGAYGLCRIESPFIGRFIKRTPIAKITESFEDPRKQADDFRYVIECAFADVIQTDRSRLTQDLSSSMSQYLTTGKLEGVDEALESEAPASIAAPGSAMQTAPQGATRAPVEASTTAEEPVAEDKAAFSAPDIDWQKTWVSLRPVAMFLTVTMVIFGVLGFVTFVVAPNYSRSGSNYSEQLKVFQSKQPPK